MRQFNVTGMSCASCSSRVEKAVSKLENVEKCDVNLLTNSMAVEGSATDEEIIKAVKDAGYGASVKGEENSKEKKEEPSDNETPVLKKRLVASVIFLLVLMYFSMGHMMWGCPVPSWLSDNHVAMGLIQLLLASVIMVINQKFFISGFKALINRSPNMDSLVALGSGASYIWSVYALFAMTGAQVSGDHEAVMRYMDEFYFESAAMILTLITLGKMLEARSKGKTTDALKSLMKLAPDKATVIRDGKEAEVLVGDVKIGDIFVVRPGENIPVDGTVTEGSGAVNESALTGESIPADKKAGDEVSAGTVNMSGFLTCEAKKVGEDTALSKIIKMVSDAASSKAPIAKIADRVSGVFVPAVITISVVTLIVWLMIGQTFPFALARAISVLVISCPCALGLATPVAIMVGSGVGAKNGILYKTAEVLENAGKIKIAALDKTGTITMGLPEVTDVFTSNGVSENELLSLAFSLEKKSEHPLAGAVKRLGEEKNVSEKEVSDFKALPGNGLVGIIGGEKVSGGNLEFIKNEAKISPEDEKKAEEFSRHGKTPLFFAKENKLLGVIAVADSVKPESREAISELHEMGIRVVMLTGDNERTARAIAEKVGVDEVIAGVKPDGKKEAVEKLAKEGKVAMVGDGINDAPPLTSADVGIAIGAGTDVAIDAADVVLMKSRLTDVPTAIRLSRATIRNIHENLFWAFIYNVIGIPLAAGCFSALGLTLNPMFGAAAMSLSSVSVVSNALRLNFFKVYQDKNSDGKTVLTVKNMTCSHCENRVREALLSVPGVTEAFVSAKSGKAEVSCDEKTDKEALKTAVEAAGYKVTKIKE